MDDFEIHEAENDENLAVDCENESNHIPNVMYSHYKLKEGLAKYITSTGQLHTSAEHVRLERLIKSHIQPKYYSFPLNVVGDECLEMFNKTKNGLVSELSDLNGTVSFASSLWSRSDNQLDFVCVTAYFVDLNWILQKRVIAFRMLEFPHSDNVIFQCIMDIFREYSIDDKVFSITFDNVLGNEVIIDMFRNTLQTPYGGQFFHMRCLSHVVSSIAQEGLKLMETRIQRIRGAILYIASSAARQQEFAALCESRGLKPRKIRPDMKTQWNSTLLMLQSCVDYYDAISEFINTRHHAIHEKDWELCFVFEKFLEVFYAVVCSLNSKVRNSFHCLGYLCSIAATFSKQKGHLGFEETYETMESKFKNYCECMLPSFCLAAAMDPRYRVESAVKVAGRISKYLSMQINMDAEALETLLHRHFKVYESQFSEKTDVASDDDDDDDDDDDFDDDEYDYAAMWEKAQRKEGLKLYGPTELHWYLGKKHYMTEHDYNNFDILAWWKLHRGEFPALSIMARDLLTASVSAMAPEFSFSTAGKQVLDHRRSMQHPKMLECFFCLKDWDAELRAESWTDDMVEYFKDAEESSMT